MQRIQCFVYLVLGLQVGVWAQAPADSVFERTERYLFASDQLLQLHLSVGLRTLLADVGETPQWHLAQLQCTSTTPTCSLPIRLSTRGHFRRQPRNCSFPPIKFDFPGDLPEDNPFAGMKKLKFVTHCRPKELYEQNLLTEYLVYKLYALFTDEAYRVRLAKVQWVDASGREKPEEHFGFFIENTKQLAARLGGRIIEIQNVHQDKTDYYKIARLALFQYMIGNTDWGVSTLHNIELLVRNPMRPPIAVPYDFDWSGFVDAPYAVPLPQFQIDRVTERVYRGYYRPAEELETLVREFQSKRSAVMRTVADFPYLNATRRQQALAYLESFYAILDNPRQMHFEFTKNCRSDEF